MNKNAKAFIEAAQATFGEGAVLTRDGIFNIVEETGLPFPYFFTKDEYRVGRGQYKLPVVNMKNKPEVVKEPVSVTVDLSAQVLALRQPKLIDESDPAVPAKYPDYVPFGFYKDLVKIIKSKQFYPVFITGHSGNGKTLSVEQACAELGREMIRVNISIETDESDLLGGPTLVNGNVVNRDGPVLTAMKRGAVLLLDEIDRGSNKMLSLNGILEGGTYFNKKTGELVYPAQGFTVIATANTKGMGSDEGRYLAQILDSAFCERFVITVEQEYPDARTEKKILSPLIEDKEFVDNLCQWADIVRQSFAQGAIDEIVSTRRLVHVAKTYNIFGDRMRAVELCVSRFDSETKSALIDLYTKIDAKVEVAPTPLEQAVQEMNVEVPF